MLNTDDIVPYCGVVLAAADKPIGLTLVVQTLKKRVNQQLKATWISHDHDNAHGGRYLTCFFSHQRPPHWAPKSGVLEVTYAYFTVGLANGYLVFHCSDNDVREIVLDLLEGDTFPVSKVSREVLNYAFIEGSAVKTLWLHGIHNKTSVKADSKALTGSDLRMALDPSGDQSYSYNSLRGNVELFHKDRTFGVNLTEAYIWLYRMNTWPEFLAACDALTDILHKAKGTSSSTPLDTVSHPISNTASMKGAYDFAIIDPTNFSGSGFGTARIALLDKIASEYEFESIHQVVQDNLIRVRVHHKHNGLLSYIGEVHAEPTLSRSQLKFATAKVNTQKGQSGKLEEFARIFYHPPLVQAWYDSGHAITGGGCYEVSYKNAPFNSMYWADFSGFDVLKEKPLKPAIGAFLSNIGSAGEDSLFSWIYHALKRGTKAKRLSHLKMTEQPDWLLCDDGSGEISDFIHATTLDNHHHLTLIHVKAAGSDQPSRLISVSAHDVVINQAIKNISSLNKANVVAALDARVPANSQKPAWNVKNGAATVLPAADFIKHISTWNSGRINFHVVIVQPHTLRPVFRNPGNSKPHAQLCTLLNSASHQIAGLGGALTVIGARG
ncbi:MULTISPECIES: hypothetical protein [unclassified Pseudoxanthomonas]|uniref:hypothetical protein n=1 Tax=unclassified Pseudoxanthomonas TaxID=2645906 RepID=UPI0030789A07